MAKKTTVVPQSPGRHNSSEPAPGNAPRPLRQEPRIEQRGQPTPGNAERPIKR